MTLKRSLRFILHPYLFAIYPVLFLYVQNIYHMELAEILVPGLVVIGLVIVLNLILSLAFVDYTKAAFMLSLGLVFFFLHGHMLRYLDKIETGLRMIDRHHDGTVLWTFGLIWLLVLVLVWRAKKPLIKTTKFMTYIGAILVAIQLILAATTWVSRPEATIDEQNVIAGRESEHKPDIIYIILDGYGRHDVVNEIFGYDNQPFLDDLRARGFFIGEASHANYCQTLQSLASSLNMDYLQNMATYDTATNDRRPLSLLYQKNRVMKFLREQGYRIVTFKTGYNLTELKRPDKRIGSRRFDLSEFENLLVQSTPLPFLIAKLVLGPFEQHYNRIVSDFETIPTLEGIAQPSFYLVHIVAPHPPFVMAADGSFTNLSGRFLYSDGNHFLRDGGTMAEYFSGYRDQLHAITEKTKRAIDSLLTVRADNPPVIIIQGDHGPGSKLDWYTLGNTDVTERLPILYAVYTPPTDTLPLYNSITPVNTFRVLLDHYFDAELGLLEDRAYYSTWLHPYVFYDVTAAVRDQSADAGTETESSD